MFVVAATAAAGVCAAEADKPCELAPLPEGAVPESYAAVLSRQRPGLEAQRGSLLDSVAQFRSKCGRVLVGSKLETECAGEEKPLRARIDEYQSACESYNAKTTEAVYLNWTDKRRAAGNRLLASLRQQEKNATESRDRQAAEGVRRRREREEAFLAAERRLLDPHIQRYIRNSRLHAADVMLAVRVIGDVCIIQSGRECVSISSDGVMLPGDKIKTGSDSYGELVFAHGERMTIGPNSEWTFEINGSSTLMGRLHFHFQMLKTCGGSVACRDTLRKSIKSANVTVSIRGTEYMIETAATKSASITVLQGVVEVTDGNQTVSVGAGQRLSVGDDGRIGQSHAVDLTRMFRWWERAP